MADIGYGTEDAAECFHFRHGTIEGCLGASADGDCGAIGQQAFGDGAADAAGAAGDDRNFAVQGVHGGILSRGERLLRRVSAADQRRSTQMEDSTEVIAGLNSKLYSTRP